MTILELKLELEKFPNDYEITIGPNGGLTIYRFKQSGEKLINIEFEELVEVVDN